MEFLDKVGIHARRGVSLDQVVEDIKTNPNARKAGALATFVGIVREDPVDSSGGKVRYLKYEEFEKVAELKLRELRNDLVKKEGIVDVSIHHVVDRVEVGEESLIVAVLGTHRRYVFRVLQEAVERVKEEVPIWKKEITSDDAYWVSNAPRSAIEADRG